MLPLPRNTGVPEPTVSARKEFLSLIGHELRTPLNSVIGFSSLLVETIASPGERQLAAAIHVSAPQPGGERILHFSDITSGDLQLSEAQVPAGALLQHAAAIARTAAKASGKQLELGTCETDTT